MPDPNQVPGKIIEVIKKRGPSLPIQIAKDVGISSLFASAFLSELFENRKIKMSTLRVGGSPVYFIVGQEEQLNKFSNYLHPKEYEALELLKSKKYLKDSEQEPAIRVALRSIKDFAENFKKDDQLYWKLILTPESEIKDLLEPAIEQKTQTKIENKEDEKETEIQSKPIEEQKPLTIEKETQKSIIQTTKLKKEKPFKILSQIKSIQTESLTPFENPLVEKIIDKPIKEKPKSDFVLKVIYFLAKNNFKILEEKDYKAREYLCIAEYSTSLGPISFLTLAKDKKSVSEEDLKKLLIESQKIPTPALYIFSGTLSKKAQEYQNKYYSILKTLKLG